MTLIGPTTGSEGQRLWRYAVGLAMDSVFESLGYNLTLLRMWSQMGLRRYFLTVPFMLRDRPISLASRVACPVLVVRGQHDYIVRAGTARRLAAALPDGRLVEVPGVAHAVQFDRPGAFAELLLPFAAAAEGDGEGTPTRNEAGGYCLAKQARPTASRGTLGKAPRSVPRSASKLRRPG